jgi:hypothetical protein
MAKKSKENIGVVLSALPNGDAKAIQTYHQLTQLLATDADSIDLRREIVNKGYASTRYGTISKSCGSYQCLPSVDQSLNMKKQQPCNNGADTMRQYCKAARLLITYP